MSVAIRNGAGSKRSSLGILRELVDTRKTLWVLIRRDLKLRYAGSMLGWVWTVLEPLMMSSIYWFVFTVIFHRRVGDAPYIIFLLAGLLPWFWFTNGLSQGADALVSQRRLLASTALPRQIWVLRSVGAKGCEFLFSVPVFLLFLIFYHPQYNVQLLYIPLGLVLELILLIGLGLLLSPIMVLVRDLKPIIRLITRVMFYASPVIYGFHDIASIGLPEPVTLFYGLNPMTGILECFRSGFFDQAAAWHVIVSASIVSVFVLFLGWFVFKRLESTVLKEI